LATQEPVPRVPPVSARPAPVTVQKTADFSILRRLGTLLLRISLFLTRQLSCRMHDAILFTRWDGAASGIARNDSSGARTMSNELNALIEWRYMKHTTCIIIMICCFLTSCVTERASIVERASTSECMDDSMREYINSITLSLPYFDEQIERVRPGETIMGVLKRTRFAAQIGYVIEMNDFTIERPEEVASVRDLFNIIQDREHVIILMGAGGCIVRRLEKSGPAEWLKPFMQ
jgi:hypothetical protein